MKNNLKIEIGCGKKPRKGYIKCDARKLKGTDYVCKADNLPFKNSSVNELYSRHLIEHFTLKEFLKVLCEWNRVLKKGGKLYIICPNLLFHLNQIIQGDHKSFYEKKSGKNDRYWGFGSLFGWQKNKYDIHKFGYYFDLLKDILKEFGFGQIKNLTNKPTSFEKAKHHLEIEAVKIKNVSNYKNNKFFNHFDVNH